MLAEEVCARLCAAGVDAVAVRSVVSTQDEVVRLGKGAAGTPFVVVAASQTGGRGRMGRTWVSPGGGFYASILLRPVRELPAGMTVRAGAAVVSTVRSHGVAGAVLKWPNDCLVSGCKLCGILAESFPLDDILVVGIGMNVEADPGLDAVAGMPGGTRAARLSELCAADPADVCSDAVRAVISAFDDALAGAPLDVGAVGSMLWTDGPVVAFNGERGKVAGVDGFGRLMLRQPDGAIRLVSVGEVQDAGRH